MISEEKTQTQSAWDEHLEKLRNMSPQQKEEYLARKFEDGQRQARAILGKQAEPSMTREEAQRNARQEVSRVDAERSDYQG